MNDDIREKLSAYLDGALSELERETLEGELSRSEEMRLELEALRAVSAAVKGLPKEKLPSGFMARLEARRLRETKPERSYFILPPAYRPVAFALSTAVVALFVWDQTHQSAEMIAPRPGWQNEIVAVKSAAEAPPSVDVSGQLSSMGARGKALKDESVDSLAAKELSGAIAGAKKEDSAKAAFSSTFGKHISAPGKPLELQETNVVASAAGGGAGLAAPSAPAAAAPASAELEPVDGKNGTFLARNEEERSAINERLYKGFEAEKKRMGIAKIVEKDADSENRPSIGREIMALQATPEAPRLDRAASPATAGAVGSVRGVAAKARSAAPARASAPYASVVKALPLKSAEALQTAWAAAGLPGEPPSVDFSTQMALFLSGPSGCGIVSVEERKKLIVVLYKDSGFDDASARVRAATLSPKPVVVKPAP